MTIQPQPWTAAMATRAINEIARNPQCGFSFVRHVRERLEERGLIMSDLLYVLKNGFVYDAPQESTLPEFFKYRVEGQSPNSGSRYLRVVVVPDHKSCQLKAITIMWRDEV